MRILLLNVKYSPNLGDGLLSECLEAELARQPNVTGVHSIDLAGRDGYGTGWRHRRTALTILEWLPPVLRRIVAGLALRRSVARTLAPRCRAAMPISDAVVLGGGNLLADADLNFPIKIAGALAAATAADRPLGVFGVGVSDNWSRQGATLFGNALAAARLVHAAVRDERSRTIWHRRLGPYGVADASLCRDPGLLAARHLPVAARVPGRIGLCLTDPLALRYHGAARADRSLDDWLAGLVQALATEGRRIMLFTNGSPEDRSYLATVAPRLRKVGGDRVEIAPAFETPGALAAFVSSCTLLIAHRMHACIAAYSYGVPHIGLAWDPKLHSFFASVGREDYLVDPADIPAAQAAACAERALAMGIDANARAKIVAEAGEDVARLHASLVAAVAA